MKSLDSRLVELQKRYNQLNGIGSKPSGIILIQKEGKLYDYDAKNEKYFEWVEPPEEERTYSTVIIIPHNYREPFIT